MSVSCSGVVSPKIETSGPSGITENVKNAGTTAMIGAMTNTSLSAALGVTSSLSASLMPSASDWSRPNGPCLLGPIRCCMRATTRRSNQMLNSVKSTSRTKMANTLMSTSHHGSSPKPATSSAGDTGETPASRWDVATDIRQTPQQRA